MKLSKLMMSVLVLTVLGLAACNKKSSNSSGVSDARGSRGSDVGGVTTPNGSQQQGYLQSNSQDFQELVRTLVSANLDPQYLGQVDPYSGIRAAGAVVLAANGSIHSESAFRLEIADSFVGQTDEDGNVIQAYLINLSNGQGTWSGQLDANRRVPYGTANITFSDTYGTIRISGQWTPTYFTGTVSFRNNNSKYPTSMSSQCSTNECTLGQVQLPISAFFK